MNAVEVLKLPQTNFKSRSRNTLHPNDGCVALSVYQCMHRGHVNIRKLCKCLKVDKKVSDEAQSYFFYLQYELTYSKRLPPENHHQSHRHRHHRYQYHLDHHHHHHHHHHYHHRHYHHYDDLHHIVTVIAITPASAPPLQSPPTLSSS